MRSTLLHYVLLVLICVVCRGQEPDARVLNLLCWTEYVPAAVTEGFTKRSGVRVVIENYNSNEQMLAMLRAKPRHYDLVQPSQAYVEGLIQSGGVEALDAARIPNLRHLDPQFRGLPHDPEGKFSVPWMAGTVGIVVNTEAVKEPIHTWADVFTGKYRGRIVAVNDQREMVAWALASLGRPITQIDNDSLARTEPVLRAWLPQIRVFDSDSPHTALLDGRAIIGLVWSGEAALLWQRDHKFQYVLPKEGAHMFLDSLAIPTGAPHKNVAEDFINYCLEPEVSVLISKEYPYTNPNLAARKLLAPEQLANPASYPPLKERLLPLRNVGNETKAVDEFVRRIRDELTH
ncbi:MAG: spermidine/putrescine ABC transporter substrate-binding protein [Chthoniobacter sp.]|uniref:polyamine ABC transporter substrate-binding protein n=1 Tax=Chthoniobacter sp. TaxID=2510640 RepID=UPI0032AB660E